MNGSWSALRACRLALALGLGVLALGAAAQQLGDLEKKSTLSDADRAKRDADKVFQWIKFNADKAPAKPAAPAPAAPKPAPVAKAAPRHEAPAPSPKLEDLQNKPEPAVAAVAASPASEPVQLAAASPKLTPPPPAAVAPAPEPEPEPEVALKLIDKVEPEIPRQLLSSVRNGLVVVKFTVEPNGAVTGAEAIKSSHRKLSVAAVDAVNQWRFAPIPRSREVSVEIGFQAE